MSTFVFGSGHRAPKEEAAPGPPSEIAGDPAQVWALVIERLFGVLHRGYAVLISHDRSSLEAFVEARRYPSSDIVELTEARLPLQGGWKDHCISNLCPFRLAHGGMGSQYRDELIAYLFDAGYKTLGQLDGINMVALRSAIPEKELDDLRVERMQQMLRFRIREYAEGLASESCEEAA